MKKNKKQNTYVKYGLMIAASALIGGIFGIILHKAPDIFASARELLSQLLMYIQNHILIILSVILIIEFFTGEFFMKKLKKLLLQAMNMEEEAGDHMEYKKEKNAGIITAILGICTFFASTFVATVYSITYIEQLQPSAAIKLLTAFLLYMAIYIYYGYFGVRYFKLEQKMDSSKKGDPASLKFQVEYVESCDEAQKELIYQSAFRSYTLMSQCYSFALLAAMLMHLIWNTGITAIVFVGILQLIHILSYLWFSVKKRGKKLKHKRLSH